ncbi:unnamed protein product [Chrysoparadoxa australica]
MAPVSAVPDSDPLPVPQRLGIVFPESSSLRKGGKRKADEMAPVSAVQGFNPPPLPPRSGNVAPASSSLQKGGKRKADKMNENAPMRPEDKNAGLQLFRMIG